MRAADVNVRHYGEVIREEPKKSPKEANRGGPVVSRADPEIRLEVEKSKSKARLVMRVKNPTESYLSLNFTTSQTYDFIIRDKETGKVVWRWSKGNFFSRVRRNVAILPEAEWRFEVFLGLQEQRPRGTQPRCLRSQCNIDDSGASGIGTNNDHHPIRN